MLVTNISLFLQCFVTLHREIYHYDPLPHKKEMLLETYLEKGKKMLVTSIFSFSHNFFYFYMDSNHQD